MAEVQRTYVTQEFLDKMKKELDYLKSTKRLEVAQRLKEAIALGDLSENSEYDDAKDEQAFVEGKILELEAKVRTAVVIEASRSGKVGMASVVTIEDLQNGEKQTVTIVGSSESDPFANKISNESPVGRALLGAKDGDVVEVDAPAGVLKYKVLELQNSKRKKAKKES
jgi:transcription elongation factor GreA